MSSLIPRDLEAEPPKDPPPKTDPPKSASEGGVGQIIEALCEARRNGAAPNSTYATTRPDLCGLFPLEMEPRDGTENAHDIFRGDDTAPYWARPKFSTLYIGINLLAMFRKNLLLLGLVLAVALTHDAPEIFTFIEIAVVKLSSSKHPDLVHEMIEIFFMIRALGSQQLQDMIAKTKETVPSLITWVNKKYGLNLSPSIANFRYDLGNLSAVSQLVEDENDLLFFMEPHEESLASSLASWCGVGQLHVSTHVPSYIRRLTASAPPSIIPSNKSSKKEKEKDSDGGRKSRSGSPSYHKKRDSSVDSNRDSKDTEPKLPNAVYNFFKGFWESSPPGTDKWEKMSHEQKCIAGTLVEKRGQVYQFRVPSIGILAKSALLTVLHSAFKVNSESLCSDIAMASSSLCPWLWIAVFSCILAVAASTLAPTWEDGYGPNVTRGWLKNTYVRTIIKVVPKNVIYNLPDDSHARYAVEMATHAKNMYDWSGLLVGVFFVLYYILSIAVLGLRLMNAVLWVPRKAGTLTFNFCGHIFHYSAGTLGFYEWTDGWCKFLLFRLTSPIALFGSTLGILFLLPCLHLWPFSAATSFICVLWAPIAAILGAFISCCPGIKGKRIMGILMIFIRMSGANIVLQSSSVNPGESISETTIFPYSESRVLNFSIPGVNGTNVLTLEYSSATAVFPALPMGATGSPYIVAKSVGTTCSPQGATLESLGATDEMINVYCAADKILSTDLQAMLTMAGQSITFVPQVNATSSNFTFSTREELLTAVRMGMMQIPDLTNDFKMMGINPGGVCDRIILSYDGIAKKQTCKIRPLPLVTPATAISGLTPSGSTFTDPVSGSKCYCNWKWAIGSGESDAGAVFGFMLQSDGTRLPGCTNCNFRTLNGMYPACPAPWSPCPEYVYSTCQVAVAVKTVLDVSKPVFTVFQLGRIYETSITMTARWNGVTKVMKRIQGGKPLTFDVSEVDRALKGTITSTFLSPDAEYTNMLYASIPWDGSPGLIVKEPLQPDGPVVLFGTDEGFRNFQFVGGKPYTPGKLMINRNMRDCFDARITGCDLNSDKVIIDPSDRCQTNGVPVSMQSVYQNVKIQNVAGTTPNRVFNGIDCVPGPTSPDPKISGMKQWSVAPKASNISFDTCYITTEKDQVVVDVTFEGSSKTRLGSFFFSEVEFLPLLLRGKGPGCFYTMGRLTDLAPNKVVLGCPGYNLSPWALPGVSMISTCGHLNFMGGNNCLNQAFVRSGGIVQSIEKGPGFWLSTSPAINNVTLQLSTISSSIRTSLVLKGIPIPEVSKRVCVSMLGSIMDNSSKTLNISMNCKGNTEDIMITDSMRNFNSYIGPCLPKINLTVFQLSARGRTSVIITPSCEGEVLIYSDYNYVQESLSVLMPLNKDLKPATQPPQSPDVFGNANALYSSMAMTFADWFNYGACSAKLGNYFKSEPAGCAICIILIVLYITVPLFILLFILKRYFPAVYQVIMFVPMMIYRGLEWIVSRCRIWRNSPENKHLPLEDKKEEVSKGESRSWIEMGSRKRRTPPPAPAAKLLGPHLA